MVDNIHFNKISPLLSSTERIKRVDRRPRDGQHPPYKGDPQGKQKKKKKKRPGHKADQSETTSAKGPSQSPGHASTHLRQEEPDRPAGWSKRIIDIRV